MFLCYQVSFFQLRVLPSFLFPCYAEGIASSHLHSRSFSGFREGVLHQHSIVTAASSSPGCSLSRSSGSRAFCSIMFVTKFSGENQDGCCSQADHLPQALIPWRFPVWVCLGENELNRLLWDVHFLVCFFSGYTVQPGIPQAHVVAVESCLKHEAVVLALRTHILRLLFLLKLKESTMNLYHTISYKMKCKSCCGIIVLIHNQWLADVKVIAWSHRWCKLR